MKNPLSILILISAMFALSTANAEPAAAPAKKTAKKSTHKKAAAKADDDDADTEKEPDISGTITTEFHCELGNKVTIFHNLDDDQHIALRWRKRLQRLERVKTSTGANRFENARTGLVWIGIPAKSMLLNAKRGQQLANECKGVEQSVPVPLAEPKAESTPPSAPEKSAS